MVEQLGKQRMALFADGEQVVQRDGAVGRKAEVDGFRRQLNNERLLFDRFLECCPRSSRRQSRIRVFSMAAGVRVRTSRGNEAN